MDSASVGSTPAGSGMMLGESIMMPMFTADPMMNATIITSMFLSMNIGFLSRKINHYVNILQSCDFKNY